MAADDAATGDAVFRRALAHLRRGEADGLAAMLADHPGLATARSAGSAPPYDGYFHRATLLHHVAGNPAPAPPPAGVLGLARLLLDAGADVDALTRAGPSQPHDIGWTTLGLAASSGELETDDLQIALLDLLLDRGADPDRPGGGALKGALYYGQSAAAAHLDRRGARLDLVAAAGTGNLAVLGEELALEAPDLVRRPRLAHYSRVAWPEDLGPEAETADLYALALVHAALHGRLEALRLLLDAGADPTRRAPFDHQATALHWAVMGDHPEAVAILLNAGADPSLRDLEHDATPAGWARHMGRSRAGAALLDHGAQ